MSRNQRIKKALKEKRVSQETLAEKLGVTQGAVGKQLNKEEDVDSIEFFKAVSELTGFSIDFLLYGDTDDISQKSTMSEVEKLEMLVASQKRTIELLEKEVRRLENEKKHKLSK
jgi:transcriptional regulator with XRE-family HTH domain